MADFIVEAHRPDLHLTIYPDGWIPIVQDSSRRYCEGYLARAAEQSPRPAYRVRRSSDGAIVAQCPASDEPEIGMVAGWPSDEQCIRGAIKALEAARRSRREGEPDPRIAAALAVLTGPAVTDGGGDGGGR